MNDPKILRVAQRLGQSQAFKWIMEDTFELSGQPQTLLITLTKADLEALHANQTLLIRDNGNFILIHPDSLP